MNQILFLGKGRMTSGSHIFDELHGDDQCLELELKLEDISGSIRPIAIKRTGNFLSGLLNGEGREYFYFVSEFFELKLFASKKGMYSMGSLRQGKQ